VKQQLGEYKTRIARLDALRGADGDAAADASASTSSGAQTADAAGELGGFVSEIPELQAKKALVRHVSVSMCVTHMCVDRDAHQDCHSAAEACQTSRTGSILFVGE
jgi:hypothetical protein